MIRKSRKLIFYIKEWILIRFHNRLHIMNSVKTIQYIKKNNCSIARYGDGEFSIMLSEGGIGFQQQSSLLATKLWDVMKRQNNDLLVCVPYAMNLLKGRKRNSKEYWLKWGLSDGRQRRIVNLVRACVGEKYIFGDSQITRPYIAMKTDAHAKRIFPLIMSLWENRNVVIVEGEATRMGVGNDLFKGAQSVKRILAPSEDAFMQYDMILETIIKNVSQTDLLVLALGPTATILAADLSEKGFQALDIGHFDIEYEWFLEGVDRATAVQGKYTNEVQNGATAAECTNRAYINQIIARVTNI